jgi:hypothetical protein
VIALLVVAWFLLSLVLVVALCRISSGADSREERARAIRENTFAEFLEHGIGPR